VTTDDAPTAPVNEFPTMQQSCIWDAMSTSFSRRRAN
jgi:hypothetical protein